MRLILAIVCFALGAGCHGATATSGPSKVDIPVSGGDAARTRTSSGAREGAPPAGTTKESPFPRVARFTLGNGLRVAVVPSHTLPVVEVRLFVRAGTGDSPNPATATLTASLLKDGTRAYSGPELAKRIETLGGDLDVVTRAGSTVLAMPLTRTELGEGLSLLSQVVREPRFDEGELKKRKARSTDAATESARADGIFAAKHLVFSALFPSPSPYASIGLLPSQIARVDGAAVREFHRRAFVPKNATLVLAGDLDEPEAKALAERHFGGWTGGEAPPRPESVPPQAPSQLRVIIAHRPRSAQSEVFVTTLGPARRDASWPAARVASEVLGGLAGRLFTDVRERRGLAYATWASALELPTGEQPFVAYAGTETSKTAQTTLALLEDLASMAASAPTPGETLSARTYASDVFAIRMESIGAIADLVVSQDEFGLSDGYWDAYRKDLRNVDPSQIDAAARALYGRVQERSLVVVAGDADAVASDLAKLGEVTIVDPEKEFNVIRILPKGSK